MTSTIYIHNKTLENGITAHVHFMLIDEIEHLPRVGDSVVVDTPINVNYKGVYVSVERNNLVVKVDNIDWEFKRSPPSLGWLVTEKEDLN